MERRSGLLTHFTLILVIGIVVSIFGNAAGAVPWCNSTIVCRNTTHFDLCIDHGNGNVHRWERGLACPGGTSCNGTKCEEIFYTTYPRSLCNHFGFTCVNTYEFQICKFDRNGWSVPFSERIHCPQRTACDNSSVYHCRDYLQPHPPLYPPQPQPQPPSLYPPLPHPNPHPNPQAPSQNKNECNGNHFRCVDSNTYLLCRVMPDGVVRPEPKQYTCPKGQVCHKSFDRPCAVQKSGASSSFRSTFVSAILFSSIVLQIVYFF